jgi:hypothetical protein
LDGALIVKFVNGFSPSFNANFPVLTAGARSGTFNTFACDPLPQPGNYINVRYLATGVELYTTDATPRFNFIKGLRPSRLVQIQITGVAGQKYAIDGSPEVIPEWTALYTNVMPGSTLMDWMDSDSTNYVRRFYRARFVP